MPRKIGNHRQPIQCVECQRTTTEHRRQRCPRCYMAQWRGHDVASECQCCGQTDRRVLVRKRLAGSWATLCGNCGVRAGRRGIGLDELRVEVAA